MTDRETLMASIIANPADDAPRLVFADWLEEHGQPERAEFIRLQIEKLKCPKCGGSGRFGEFDMASFGVYVCDLPRCLALRKREEELLDAGPDGESNEFNWCPDAIWDAICEDKLMLRRPDEFSYHRGFVERIRLDPRDFFQHARDMMARTPLRKVEFTREPQAIHGRRLAWIGRRDWPDGGLPNRSDGLTHPYLPLWHRICLAEFGEGIEFSVVDSGAAPRVQSPSLV